MRSRRLYLESFIVTLLTLIVIGMLYLLSLNINIFNVLKQSYKKIDLVDLYYSQLKSKDVSISKEIVLVNIANHSRTEIASILNIIHDNNPKVIGLDVVFKTYNHTKEDSTLLSCFNKIKNKLVVAYGLKNPEDNTHQLFNLGNTAKGYIDFLGNKKGAILRKTELKYSYNNNIEYSFAYSIIKKFNPKLTKIVDDTKIDTIKPKPFIINYVGGYNRFLPIEGTHLLLENNNLEKIKDKIVIVGYFGSSFVNNNKETDIHYTPMNKSTGHGVPDMYGALIHANIVQMMIDKSYINYWSKGNIIVGLFSTLLAFPFIVIFTYFFVRRHLWYHVAAKLTQLILGISTVFIVLNLYEFLHFKLELKFFLLLLAVSVDVLYLYEAIAVIIYKKYGKKSYFIYTHK